MPLPPLLLLHGRDAAKKVGSEGKGGGGVERLTAVCVIDALKKKEAPQFFHEQLPRVPKMHGFYVRLFRT